MKLHHLRDFVAIAQTRSLRAAARSLGLAQPALTRSLRELEAELGAALVERHARGVHLTEVGEIYLVRAQAAMAELRRGRDEVAQRQGELTGTVALGVSSAACMALMPQVYDAFRKRFPGVRLQIVEGFFRTLGQRLDDGSLDFLVGPRPDRPAGKQFHIELLFENERFVVGRHDHPLSSARRLADLVGAEWLLTGVRDQVGNEFEEVFTDNGLTPPVALTQSDSMIGVASLLSTTDMLAVLPRQWVDSPVLRHVIEIIPIQERFPGPDIVRITRANLPLTPAAEALSTLMERQAVASAGRLLLPQPDA
jgi:LysR family transcriptional regulator of abg operon